MHYLELNPNYGKYEAIHRSSAILRSLDTLEELLKLSSDTFWFLQLREPFMQQRHFEKWDPARLEEYIVVPSETGFVNNKDVVLICHYWHDKEHPDPSNSDLQLVQQRLHGGYWPDATYFWVDWTCVPQPPHSELQQAYRANAMKKYPALIRDSFMLWNFPRFEPRLWVLFEAAQYVSTQPGRPAEIEPFMTHFTEMSTDGVQSVIEKHGYTCSRSTDREILIPWLEILVAITQLSSSIRVRRELLQVMEDSSMTAYTHEETGISIDKKKGTFTLEGQFYEFTPLKFEDNTAHASAAHA